MNPDQELAVAVRAQLNDAGFVFSTDGFTTPPGPVPTRMKLIAEALSEYDSSPAGEIFKDATRFSFDDTGMGKFDLEVYGDGHRTRIQLDPDDAAILHKALDKWVEEDEKLTDVKEVPQFEGYHHYVLGQRITHHGGSKWVVRELHRDADFVVPDSYRIECETAGGGDVAGSVLTRSADYVHGSFRPTPNVADDEKPPCKHEPVDTPYMANRPGNQRCKHCGGIY